MAEQTCPAQTGPVWKLGGERCGCRLPAGHEDIEPPVEIDGINSHTHQCDCGSWWSDSIRRDRECTCYPTDPAMWTTHGGAVEPGSMYEPDPDCPRHR